MSKTKNKDQFMNDQADPAPAGNETPAQSPPPESGFGNSNPEQANPELSTIEELAKRMKVEAPVFAAVMQSRQWACGKKVTEEVFTQAAQDFLGAPIDGRKPPLKEVSENKEGS
ncbi:MAG: hypothetical protein LBF74_13560 [Treponema sp.]|jgi:hypothetical protein|nr:hypothetical protein [Treponema sp.]